MNLGESTIPLLLGIARADDICRSARLFFILWKGQATSISGVITLCVSLILFNLVNSMSGTEYKIGDVPIGGHNGIPGVPPINLPGYSSIQLGYEGSFQLSLIVLVLVYVGLHLLLASQLRAGRVSIRLNELRTELLGYDARLYKLIVFAIGAGIAGIAGILFAELGIIHRPERVQYSIFRSTHYLDHGWWVGHVARRCGRRFCDPVAHHLARHLQACRSEHFAWHGLYHVCAACSPRHSAEIA